MNIWVLSEEYNGLPELLTQARRIISEAQVTCVVDPKAINEPARLIRYGADRVMLLPLKPDTVPFEAYTDIIIKEVLQASPDLLLFASTRRLKEVAARVAAALGIECISEAGRMAYDAENRSLEISRVVYGGLAACHECVALPVIVGVSPSCESVEAEERQGETIQIHGQPSSSVTVEKTIPRIKQEVNLKDAKAVVGFGRGVEVQEDIPLINRLAELLKAEIACSRPIADDYHWLPEERYIGITGQAIKPELYFCIGISGQIQHMTGVREAKAIVAVNKDKAAPVFQLADYGIVADFREIVPLLVQKLQERTTS